MVMHNKVLDDPPAVTYYSEFTQCIEEQIMYENSNNGRRDKACKIVKTALSRPTSHCAGQENIHTPLKEGICVS